VDVAARMSALPESSLIVRKIADVERTLRAATSSSTHWSAIGRCKAAHDNAMATLQQNGALMSGAKSGKSW